MSRVVRLHQTGPAEVLCLEDEAVGDPGPGQARVRQLNVAVSDLDLCRRSGRHPLALPGGLGTEAVGRVEAISPDVTFLMPGDLVAYVSGPVGACAELRLMPACWLIRLPQGLDASLPSTFVRDGLMAQMLLRQPVDRHAGGLFLYQAGSASMGRALAQWAAVLGMRMVASADSAALAHLLREAGCPHVIERWHEDVAEAVRELTQGRWLGLVLDDSAGETLASSSRCLREWGGLVLCRAGQWPEAAGRSRFSTGSHWVAQPSLADFCVQRPRLLRAADEFFGLVQQGRLTPGRPLHFELAEVAQAHRAVECGQALDGALLRP